MSKLPEITLITTTNCKHCHSLIKDLIPIAKQYHLKITHLVAKRMLNDSRQIVLFDNHRKVGFLPESYCIPEARFPILICMFDPPVAMVGDLAAKNLVPMLEQVTNGVTSLEDILPKEQSNIDSVVQEYEQMPGGSKIYESPILSKDIH